jgi:cytochrome P450
MNPLRYLLDGYRWLVDPYALLDRALARHGLTFRIRLPVLGKVLMTGDPALIGEIVHHPGLEGGKAIAALRAILGSRSLIMLDGEAHAARRRLIAPAFRGDGLAAYDALTIRATQGVFASVPIGRTFSVYEVLRRIGLKAMVAAMFGDGSVAAHEAEHIVERFLDSFRNPLVLFVRALRIDAGRWTPWGRALRNRHVLGDLIRRQIARCRQQPNDSMLGQLAGADIGDDDLVEEVLSLLLFGHDTAAAAMAWAFMHIHADPLLVERLRVEAECADLDALPLLHACIQESMRLCPVVVHLGRTAAADLTLGGFRVRRGETVIPCTYLAHHNPSVFPEPYAFRPERFAGGQRHEHSYFPFGFGSRTCVGKPFAMRQMLLVLATAIRDVALEPAPGYVPTPERHLVLIVPRGGGLMRRRTSVGRISNPSITLNPHGLTIRPTEEAQVMNHAK